MRIWFIWHVHGHPAFRYSINFYVTIHPFDMSCTHIHFKQTDKQMIQLYYIIVSFYYFWLEFIRNTWTRLYTKFDKKCGWFELVWSHNSKLEKTTSIAMYTKYINIQWYTWIQNVYPCIPMYVHVYTPIYMDIHRYIPPTYNHSQPKTPSSFQLNIIVAPPFNHYYHNNQHWYLYWQKKKHLICREKHCLQCKTLAKAGNKMGVGPFCAKYLAGMGGSKF